jgi:hypothetical protein
MTSILKCKYSCYISLHCKQKDDVELGKVGLSLIFLSVGCMGLLEQYAGDIT